MSSKRSYTFHSNFTNIEEAIGGESSRDLPILVGKLPVPRNTAVSKIGNGVVSLLRLLQCNCNPAVHNKFPSFSNTILVVIFLDLCRLPRS